MAEFLTAYNITAANEGTYDNHPRDTGGETVFGVARNSFPKWEGWELVERLAAESGVSDYTKRKGNKTFYAALEGNIALRNMVKALYKSSFWDIFELDKIDSQELANEIFDQAVNLGA